MSEEWNFVRKSKKNNKISEDTVIGRFSMSSNSFAFIKDINNENIREVFISKGKTLNSINGDIVKAKIIEKNKKGFEGQVIEVIKRKHKILFSIVSHLFKGNWILHVPILGKSRSVYCTPYSNLCTVEMGDIVLVEIINWGSGNHDIHGKILETFGNVFIDPLDTRSILIENNSLNYLINQNEIERENLLIPDSIISNSKDITQKFNIIIFEDNLMIYKIDGDKFNLGFIFKYFLKSSNYNNEVAYRNFVLCNKKERKYFNTKNLVSDIINNDKLTSAVIEYILDDDSIQLKKIDIQNISIKNIYNLNETDTINNEINELINLFKKHLYKNDLMIKRYRHIKFMSDIEILLNGIFETLKNTTYFYLKNLNIDFCLKTVPIYISNRYDLDEKSEKTTRTNKNSKNTIQNESENIKYKDINKYKNKYKKNQENRTNDNYNQYNILNLEDENMIENNDNMEEEEIIDINGINNLMYYNSNFRYLNNDKDDMDYLLKKVIQFSKVITIYKPEKIPEDNEINKSLPFFNPYYNFLDSLIIKQIFRHLFSNRGIDFGQKVNLDKLCDTYNLNEKQLFRIECENFKLYILKQLDEEFKQITEKNKEIEPEQHKIISFNAKINKVKPYAIFFDIPELSIQDSIHVACLGGCIFKYNNENMSLYNSDKSIIYYPQQIIKIKVDKIDLVKREIRWVIC